MHRYFLTLLFLILFPCLAFGDSGTLIVTYQSGSQGERLDRIRFWLKNEDGLLQFYPKEEGYLEDDESLSRKVVIENLPTGNYTLLFALPNYDGLFEPIPERKASIASGEVVKINLQLKTNEIVEKSKTPPQEELAYEPLPGLIAQTAYGRPLPTGVPARRPVGIYNYGNYGYNPYYYGDFFNATVNIKPNLTDARWQLLSGPAIVQSGVGDTPFISVPANTFYTVQAEQKDGYKVTIEPQSFSPRSGDNITVRIYYSATRGKVEIQANVPQGETLRATLKPLGSSSSPISAPLKSVGGQAVWRSPPLPTGKYQLTYQLPPQYTPLPPEVIQVVEGQTVFVIPQITPGRTLHVQTNIPAAAYTLTAGDGSKTYQGKGSDYVFQHLLPGRYTLTFISTDPQYQPPQPQKIEIPTNRNISTKGEYRRLGQLTITTNIPNAAVSITATRGPKMDINETIPQGQRTFPLPEGDYRIYFYPPRNDVKLRYAARPDPIDVSVTAGQSSSIYGEYGTPTENAPPSSAGPEQPFPPPPPPQQIPEEAPPYVDEAPKPTQALIEIPPGEAIIGDLFKDGSPDELPARRVFIDSYKIGTYEVTNAEYIQWLNEALKKGTITYQADGNNQGNVYNTEGKLLCKTSNADPNSQIMVSKPGHSDWSFFTLVGKEHYPVINVTWYGANAYCEDKNGRLPSEAEWEKAAGMARTQPGVELKKFKFGTGTDTISRRQANYKDNDQPMTQMRVNTSPVGFYNGINPLPLRIGDKGTVVTENSPSPYGAYDMSGNVFEWVNDWYSADYFANMPERNPRGPDHGDNKVAKGGCYDSLADGVRVSGRLPLPPEHADVFTGFRIVFD